MRARASIALAVLLVIGHGLASAQERSRSVALTGQMGRQALMSIDGAPPRVMAVGASVGGVKLVSLGDNSAVVEVDGVRRTLRLGESAVNVGGAPSAGNGSEIKLSVDARGHFGANGQINGRGVNFMVDTGATMIALSKSEADRIGLNYKNGQPIGISTANGNTVGYRVMLNTVRIGDVEVYNVEAVVQPAPMPFVLLGNSYLGRFQMKRENDTMTLQRRF